MRIKTMDLFWLSEPNLSLEILSESKRTNSFLIFMKFISRKQEIYLFELEQTIHSLRILRTKWQKNSDWQFLL